ncbi:MAG: TaqI-like C-terminal specificity domain-containing protein, partial [Acidimicrobiia bacterium]
PEVYAQERIGVRQIGQVPIATILPAGLLTLNTIYNIYFTRSTPYSLPFILGMISSSVVQWFWRQMHFDQKKTFPKIKKEALLSIPVPRIDFADPREKQIHDKITSHVTHLLEMNQRLSKARTANEREGLRRRVEAFDKLLDRMISQLYGLTDEEAALLQPDTAKGL